MYLVRFCICWAVVSLGNPFPCEQFGWIKFESQVFFFILSFGMKVFVQCPVLLLHNSGRIWDIYFFILCFFYLCAGVAFDLFTSNGPKSGWSFGARNCPYVQDWQEQVRDNCKKLDPEVCYGLMGCLYVCDKRAFFPNAFGLLNC